LEKHREFHPERNPLLGLTRRFFPVTSDYAGASFLVRRAGVLMLTPLLLVLIMVESADVLFAVDSIPAVFAITQDPFIVYTSNVFAILGLRTLYFLLAGAIAKFRYLHPALAVILVLVGLKMLLAHFYRLPTWLSLAVICLIFGIAILLSLLRGKSSAAEEASGEV
jgi:tellurite resistance protein TerC